jgi:poly(3-hydroxybutyrate) depolymerase
MTSRIWSLAALVCTVAAVAEAAPLPSGRGEFACTATAETIRVFTYKPAAYRDGPIVVVCHGVSRNAADYRDYAITLAERFNVLVVAPLFDKERFPLARYQRGGLLGADGAVQPRDAWTYAFIPRIVAQVRELEGRPALPYYLIGHSAGGQFLGRLAAFLPGEAVRIVAANPGSHLFPDREQEFGYGFGGLPSALSDDAVLRAYLAAPLTLYLGTGDITPEHSFDQSPAGMRQGPNRLERGRACFAAAERLARARGWAFNWTKVETPGIAHDGARMFAAPEVGRALFGNN